jgi:hypothetical protein
MSRLAVFPTRMAITTFRAKRVAAQKGSVLSVILRRSLRLPVERLDMCSESYVYWVSSIHAPTSFYTRLLHVGQSTQYHMYTSAPPSVSLGKGWAPLASPQHPKFVCCALLSSLALRCRPPFYSLCFLHPRASLTIHVCAQATTC